jgi:hypothetical protein
MRAYSAVNFDWDDSLTISWPNAVGILQSEYTGGEHGNAYPVTIHAEIRGEAESLEDAEPWLASLIGETLAPLSLAGNAAIADPLAVATYGVDLSRPQPFRGYRTPEPEEFFPPGGRRFDVAATHDLLAAVGSHPETEILRRAVEAYRHALGYWTPEARLLAGEFLYIASETLSRFLVESRARDGGMTPKNLARSNGLAGPDKLRSQFMDEIFSGHNDVRESLEKASNGFEHGYMASGNVVDLVDPVLEPAFGLVRAALIEHCGVNHEVRDVLLSDRYSEPRTLLPPLNVVEGEISRIDPSALVPDLPVGSIDLRWEGGRPIATKEGEDVQIGFNWSVTLASASENVQFRPLRQGLRAAYVRPVKPAE